MSSVSPTFKYYPEDDAPQTSSSGSSAAPTAASGSSAAATDDGTYTANCDPSLAVGQVVYLTADNGGTYTAHPVNVTQLDQVPAQGVVNRKYSSTLCQVTARGTVAGVFSGLAANKSYWVSPAGVPAALPLTSLPPGACFQRVGVALSSSILDINMGSDIVKTAS